MGQKSVDEILDTLNRSDLEKRRDQEDRYRQLHSWYFREHASLSQATEYGMGFGLMALSLVYMGVILRRRSLM